MKISYAKDCRNNYLVLEQSNTEVFSAKMLEKNSISGFLSSEIRFLDGDGYFYYNISGKQSLSDLFDKRSYDAAAFEELMWDLGKATEQCEEFFLPIEGLCLDPRYVFYDLGSGRWEFLFIPCDNREEFAEEKIRLAEFLALHGDPDDEELNRKAYAFYEDAAIGKLVPWEYVRKEQQTEDREPTWNIVNESPEESLSGKEGLLYFPNQNHSEEQSENRILTEESEAYQSGSSSPRLVVMGVIFAVVAFAGRKYSLAVAVLFSILATSCVAVYIKALVHTGKETAEKNAEEPPKDGLFSNRNSNVKEEQKELTAKYDTIPARGKETEYASVISDATQDSEETDARTVYIEQDDFPTRLCGEGRFRQWRIDLDSLPITIGKDGQLADYTLSHNSVSRLHAKLFEEESRLYVQDMNSTNGTFRNGIRLNPNEKAILSRGDEVEIGRVLFVCR